MLIVWLGRPPITSLMSKLGLFLYLISTVIIEKFFLSSDGPLLPGGPLEMTRCAVTPRFMQVC